MAQVDPSQRKKENIEKGFDPDNPERRKISVFDRWQACKAVSFLSETGKHDEQVWLVWFVVADPASPDYKISFFRRFYITDKARGFFTDLAIGLDVDFRFDDEDEDDVVRVLQHNNGIVNCKFKKTNYKGKERIEVSYFSTNKVPPSDDAIEDAREQSLKDFGRFQEYLEKQADKRAAEGSSGGSGGGGGGGGGGSADDDDIPF